MDPRPCFVLLAVLSLFPFAFTGGSSAERINSEEEPNDSFGDADRIWEGTTTGNVSISNTGNDTDFFVVSIPGHQTVRLSIDRDPGDGLAVFVSVFDRVGNLNSDIFIIGDFSKNFRSDEWVNRADNPRDLIIRLSGDGSYTLKVEFIFVLSNYVGSYVSLGALFGTSIAFILGLFLGFFLSRRGAKNKDEIMSKWEKTRQKGFWRYVILYGVLLFGLTLAVTQIAIHETIDTSRTPKIFWAQVIISLILWSFGGLVMGIIGWRSQEKRYMKWIEEKENENRIRPRWERPRPGSIRN